MDELPDLSFDLDETGFEGDSLDDDLQSLEAELGELAGPVEELDASSSESTMTVDENTEQATQVSSEFDLNELDDLPDFTLNASEKNIEHEGPQESQEIDLEELAASDDEFDFLAGTDECATKLDLARAYLDMEDIDGAKELLQEVATEGSDQQKQDARALMDSIG
jgi:pilus assembly protein FimV